MIAQPATHCIVTTSDHTYQFGEADHRAAWLYLTAAADTAQMCAHYEESDTLYDASHLAWLAMMSRRLDG